MQATYQYAVLAFICTLLLGLAVFAVNVRRPTNRSFFLLTITISTWLFAVMAGLFSHTSARAAFWIRFCSVVGGFLPATFHLLRLSVIYHRESWTQHFRRALPWFASAIALGAFCWTPFFLNSVLMVAVSGQPGATQPDPQYAVVGWTLFRAYLLIGFLSLAYLLVRDQFNARIVGTQRAELQFLLVAYMLVVVTILVTILVNGYMGANKMAKYAPLRFVGFTLIIAYGITSRGILKCALRF